MFNSRSCSTHDYNKFAYFGFLILGTGMSLFMGDYVFGASMISLSVIFYPFDCKAKWQDKSLLQKGVLLAHIAVAVALITYSLFILAQ